MRDDWYLEKSLMAGWQFLTGDICFTEHGGKWYREIAPDVYHVIELINMVECTGDETQDTYNVGLQEVDLNTTDIASALDFCGYDFCGDESLMHVEAISSYGNYLPMGHKNGNNYRKLLAWAKKESATIAGDADHAHYMRNERAVNALGSTATEMAQGDFQSAMIRGVASGDRNAWLVGRIGGIAADTLDEIEGDEELKHFSFTHGSV